MLDFDLLKDCYGCGACVNVCPRGAVHMTQAADGSYIPEIDEARCIGCGRCDRVCIHQHADKKSYAAGQGRLLCGVSAGYAGAQSVGIRGHVLPAGAGNAAAGRLCVRLRVE